MRLRQYGNLLYSGSPSLHRDKFDAQHRSAFEAMHQDVGALIRHYTESGGDEFADKILKKSEEFAKIKAIIREQLPVKFVGESDGDGSGKKGKSEGKRSPEGRSKTSKSQSGSNNEKNRNAEAGGSSTDAQGAAGLALSSDSEGRAYHSGDPRFNLRRELKPLKDEVVELHEKMNKLGHDLGEVEGIVALMNNMHKSHKEDFESHREDFDSHREEMRTSHQEWMEKHEGLHDKFEEFDGRHDE
jgi:hypothetical protein